MQVFLVLNGQSAGPFDEAQARAMLAAGQAGPDTLCCPVGEQAWRPLGSVLGGGNDGGGINAPAMPLGPYGGGGGMPFPVAAPTNNLAVTSLVLGCASVLCSCATSIPAIICGHIALNQIKRSQGTQGGRGLAIGGLVAGYVMTGLILLYILFVFVLGFASFATSGR